MKPGPRDVLRAVEEAIARGGPNLPEIVPRRDIRPRKVRQLPLKGFDHGPDKMLRLRK
jgi:hypothetical protein